MNAEDFSVSEDELHAYADGRLEAARHAAVAEWLAAHPDRAAEIADWQRQNEAIAALYGHVGKEPVPARLSPRALARDLRHRRAGVWRLAAAAVFVFAVGIGSGYLLRGPGTPVLAPDERLIAAAVDAHQLFSVQKRHPVEVVATEKAHLTTWLSNTLDRRLVMPDLSGAGLSLVGGRLLPSGASAAAQVMYQTASGDRVTLYITPRSSSDPGATRYEHIGRLGALYWATAAITCTIVGDLPRAEMETIAHAVYGALSFGDEDYPRG